MDPLGVTLVWQCPSPSAVWSPMAWEVSGRQIKVSRSTSIHYSIHIAPEWLRPGRPLKTRRKFFVVLLARVACSCTLQYGRSRHLPCWRRKQKPPSSRPRRPWFEVYATLIGFRWTCWDPWALRHFAKRGGWWFSPTVCFDKAEDGTEKEFNDACYESPPHRYRDVIPCSWEHEEALYFWIYQGIGTVWLLSFTVAQ